MNKVRQTLPALVFIFLAVSLVLAGCDGRPIENRMLESPFTYLTKVGDNELWLRLSDEIDASEFYDFRIFSGLRPGSTLCEAEALLGPPGSAYEERKGQNRVFPFPMESGVIEIYHHRVPSDDVEIVWEFHWCLRARLNDADLNEYLPSSVIEFLNTETLAQRYSLSIFSDFASVTYEIENEKILEIEWNADEKTIRRDRENFRKADPPISETPTSPDPGSP